MKTGLVFGIVLALGVHAALLLYGGRLVPGHHAEGGRIPEVELLHEEAPAKAEPTPEPEEKEPAEQLEAVADEVPESAEIVQNVEVSAAAGAPELEAASLSAIEAALGGGAGAAGGDFSEALSFSSGGRIGGTAKARAAAAVEEEFSMSEIDQKPRVVFQSPPVFPASMKKTEGVVTLTFIVDASGKATKLTVEKSSHPEFEKPALEAVRQWKFEPAIKAGQRVPCKMRIPIRFQPKQ